MNPEKFQFMILQNILWSRYCLTIGPSNANYKLHALRRMKKNLAVVEAKLLGNAFIHIQFNSTPFI